MSRPALLPLSIGLSALCLLLGSARAPSALAAPASPASREAPSPLAPLAFLVGTHHGEGEVAQAMAYDEEMSAEWGLSGDVLTLRSTSRAGDRVVFEDLRVFSYDRVAATIRCRQFCFGWVTTYDVGVDEETGIVTMEETAAEGGKTAKWRYRLEPREGGFSYVLDKTERDGSFARFTEGSLSRR